MSSEPLQLVVTGNVVMMQRCALSPAHFHPMTEAHHVCPKSWWEAAGKPVNTPMITLCPNCHMGIHVCIDAIIRKQDASLMQKRWMPVALRAFSIASFNGLTPSPTL